MRILACDDELSIVRLIEISLQARGHEVDAASSATEAIDWFELRRLQGKSYDLILLDINMPVQSGFAVGGHVRGKGYAGRLVFLTAGKAEFENFAHLNAEYWPKLKAIDNLVERVENLPLHSTEP